MRTQQQMIERRLDELEDRLPALPAASLRVQRLIMARMMSAAADVFDAIQGSTRTTVDRTRETTSTAVRTVADATRSAGMQTAEASREAVTDVIDDAVAAMEAVEDVVDPTVSPTGESYQELTKAQLYTRAAELDIPGRSSMNKGQLIDALSSS